MQEAQATPPTGDTPPSAPSAHAVSGAHNRIRTDDLFLTKEVLYRLSYVSESSKCAPILLALPVATCSRGRPFGAPASPLSPASRAFTSRGENGRFGAGSGNRTRAISLEG